MIISILLSLLFIPALVLYYFCFLMSIMLLFGAGVSEGAVVPALLAKKRELYLIFLQFFSGAIICTTIPVLWFCYL